MLDLDTLFCEFRFSRGFALGVLDWGFRSKGVRGPPAEGVIWFRSSSIARNGWVIIVGYGGELFRILQIYVSRVWKAVPFPVVIVVFGATRLRSTRVGSAARPLCTTLFPSWLRPQEIMVDD